MQWWHSRNAIESHRTRSVGRKRFLIILSGEVIHLQNPLNLRTPVNEIRPRFSGFFVLPMRTVNKEDKQGYNIHETQVNIDFAPTGPHLHIMCIHRYNGMAYLLFGIGT